MASTFQWTMADVDALVGLPKTLRSCPEASDADHLALFFCTVRLDNADFDNVDIRFRSFGLGACLLVNNIRIRVLDHHYRKRDRAGSYVYGWHEDFWVTPGRKDVRAAAVTLPPLASATRQQVVDAALLLWNIAKR